MASVGGLGFWVQTARPWPEAASAASAACDAGVDAGAGDRVGGVDGAEAGDVRGERRRRAGRRCGRAGARPAGRRRGRRSAAQVGVATGGRPSSARSALPAAASVGLESTSVPSRSKTMRAISAAGEARALAGWARHAAFHLIEQPIAGICSRGPWPVAAICFIASKSSRRAPGCGLRAAVVEPAAVLQLELGIEAEEVGGAGGAVGAGGGLVDVVQVGEGQVVLAGEGAHVLVAVLRLRDAGRSSRSRPRRSPGRGAPCRRGQACRSPPARRGSGCR